jgi:hypothetical protein
MFMFPMALAAATWGVALRWRGVAWGVTAIAVTTLLLTLANDEKRPSGLRLLERSDRGSYFSTPRWQGQGEEVHAAGLVRFVDETLPDGITVALHATATDPSYTVFGRGLDRRLVLLPEDALDVDGVEWAFVSPYSRGSLDPTRWRLEREIPGGWRVYRRR